MMKMLIKLDEERIKAEGKYDLADMWRKIDEQFEKACTKEVQPDGAALYSGDTQNDYYTCIGLAYLFLRKQQWFAAYCSEWIMFSNEDDEDLPLVDENLLDKERSENPLFAVE